MQLVLKKALHFSFTEYAQPWPTWQYHVDQFWCFEGFINLLIQKYDKQTGASGQNFSIATTFLYDFVFAVVSISALSKLTCVNPLLDTMYCARSHHWLVVSYAGLTHKSSFWGGMLQVMLQSLLVVVDFWHYSLPSKYLHMHDDFRDTYILSHIPLILWKFHKFCLVKTIWSFTLEKEHWNIL